MYGDIYHFVASWLPDYARDNRNYLTVAIGCTGGQHRSVYLVERLAQAFSPRYQVLVRHRELARQRALSPVRARGVPVAQTRIAPWVERAATQARGGSRRRPRAGSRSRSPAPPACRSACACSNACSPHGVHVDLVYSPAAQVVARQECDLTLPTQPREAARMLAERYRAGDGQLIVFGREDWLAPMASGSNPGRRDGHLPVHDGHARRDRRAASPTT